MAITVFLGRTGIDPAPFVGRLGSRKFTSFQHGPFLVEFVPAPTRIQFESVRISTPGMAVRLPIDGSVAAFVAVDGVEWNVYAMYTASNRAPPRGPILLWQTEGRLFR